MKPTVAVDLDGVLAVYGEWQGLDHIGEPLAGAQAFCGRLQQFSRVLIFTTRCSTEPPDRAEVLDDHPEVGTPMELAALLRDKVKAWLDRHQFPYDDIWVGQGKPLAAAFVDDRAVQCRPQDLGDRAYLYAEAICKLYCAPRAAVPA